MKIIDIILIIYRTAGILKVYFDKPKVEKNRYGILLEAMKAFFRKKIPGLF